MAELKYAITHFEFGVRGNVTHKPDEKFLEALKEEGIFKMISDFYDLLRVSKIKNLFPIQDDKEFLMAKEHSAFFFIQLCGGPDYFNQARGAPMMAARHSKFKITPSARIIWLKCFKTVIQKLNIDDEQKDIFWKYLDIFSHWMVNTPK
jgi:hemoglobin